MSVLVFVGVYAIGNPIDILINPQADQAERAARDRGARPRQAAVEQYFVFLRGALHGDLGHSFVYSTSALGLILERMPATLELAFVAMVIAIVLGIPLGLWAGLKPRFGRADARIMAGSILGFSLPTFWVGPDADHGVLGACSAGCRRTGAARPSTLLGVPVIVPHGRRLAHLILPAINLALFKLALMIRLTRAGTREALLQDYVKFARAKGLHATRA